MATSSISSHYLRLYGSLSTALLIAVFGTTLALPLSPLSSYDFCRSRNDIQQLYNIGADFYIAQSSSKVFKYDGTARRLAPKRTNNNELFGNKKFSWVDTVLSLNGFCLAHGNACERNASLKNLERLNLVIGSDKAHGYGFVLYESLPNKGAADLPSSSSASLKQVTYKDGYLNEPLSAIGLPLKASEEEAMIMDGEFWPKNAGNFYFKSGLYIPERGEVLFNGHPPKDVHAVKLLRGRFFFGQTKIQWTEMKVEIVGGSSSAAPSNPDKVEGLFAGMFASNGRSYAVDKRNVYEMQFLDQEDKVVFRSVGSLKEMVDCYDNSTLYSPVTIVDKMAPQEISSSTTTSTTTITTVSSTKTGSSSASTTETDVEIFEANPHSRVKTNSANSPSASSAENQSGEIKEDETSENDLINRTGPKKDSQPKDVIEEGDDENLESQSDDPTTQISGPVQLPHVNPKDDGLVWTFSILVGVLILLAIIILIPILIIRHNARSDRLYLNKKTKKNGIVNGGGGGANGNSQNSEEVQLMNSSNIEK